MKTFEQMTFDEKIEHIQAVSRQVKYFGNDATMFQVLIPWLIEECQRLRVAVLKQGVNE